MDIEEDQIDIPASCLFCIELEVVNLAFHAFRCILSFLLGFCEEYSAHYENEDAWMDDIVDSIPVSKTLFCCSCVMC